MASCIQCDNEIGEAAFCPYCGAAQDPSFNVASQTASAQNKNDVQGQMAIHDQLAQLAAVEPSGTTVGSTAPKNIRGRILLLINGVIFAILIALVGIGLSTAVHWTKVDVPEHPETFHNELQDTGTYDVNRDNVFPLRNVVNENATPCYVGQDWTDCTNLLIAEYNSSCTGRPISTETTRIRRDYFHPEKIPDEMVDYGKSSADLCNDYADMIDEMQEQDGYGVYVASLGDWGYLHSERRYEVVSVSNNDYSPAITHEAVCYFGFLGECDMPDKNKK